MAVSARRRRRRGGCVASTAWRVCSTAWYLVDFYTVVAALVLALMACRYSRFRVYSWLILPYFVMVGVLYLRVFVEAMWAIIQGRTYVEFVGFKEEWYSMDLVPISKVSATIMPSTSYVRAVLSVYVFMGVVVPLLAKTDTLQFLGPAAIALGLVIAPYTLGKVGLTLFLAFVYKFLGALASDLFLNVVGWVLGSRVTTWVRKWPPVGSWAGVALALWDGWRADSYGRKILMWMLTLMGGAASSTASWIVCGISSMASILYSEGSDVFFLSPNLIASFVLWLAIWIVVRHFSTHSVVRCGSFLMATSLVNATGHLWILIKIASAVIFIDTTLALLWKRTCSVSTSGALSES